MGGISGIDGVGEKRGEGHGDIGGELRGEDKSLSRIPEPGPSIKHRSFPALCLRIKIMTTGMMKVHSTEPNPVAIPTMAVTEGKTTAKLAAADRMHAVCTTRMVLLTGPAVLCARETGTDWRGLGRPSSMSTPFLQKRARAWKSALQALSSSGRCSGPGAWLHSA